MGRHDNRAAGGRTAYFLMAYIGFSLPVVLAAPAADRHGTQPALLAFGGLLVVGCGVL